jgi:phage tail sheath protein FI
MADINRIFAFLEKPILSRFKLLRQCKTLLVSPTGMRRTLLMQISNEIKAAADSFLLELVGKRALYDYLVVCDESNNTPTRVDRSELWLDIAVEPVKAVEFIYIPLRLKNTGDITAGL